MKKKVKVVLNTVTKEKTLVDKILKLIFVQDIFYNHKEDRCVYFIFEQELYGYATLQSEAIDKGMYLFWKDDSKFDVVLDEEGERLLEKTRSIDFLYLGYDDLVDLYSRLNLDYNIQANKDDLEKPNDEDWIV